MKIHVYDTHVTTTAGDYLHFDVLVNDENASNVHRYVNEYLSGRGITSSEVKSGVCNFCHSEIANPEVQETVQQQGHYILPLNFGT